MIVGDDAALHREFLQKFIRPTADMIAELDAAFADGNLAQVGALGHKLKSSSRTVGANALADLCAGLEQAGKSGNKKTVETLHAKLAPLFAEARDFITQME